mmetsp:Transcript_40007/g.52375  ORF Transcript_40007/g.52375 Transcript_40007/m.52375 type:complete len:207 (-) Transcript_40007:232-852(-)
MAFLAASAARAFSRFSRRRVVLRPITPPPHFVRAAALSLKRALALSQTFSKAARSAGRMSLVLRATTAAFFWWTRVPRRPRLLTITYGTSILRQRAGSQRTSSAGSTSEAMTTRPAFLFSMRYVTWFKPNLMWRGRLESSEAPAALPSAESFRRSFFSAEVSGRYLSRSLNTGTASERSSGLRSWLMAGGTLRRWYKILRWRWRRT